MRKFLFALFTALVAGAAFAAGDETTAAAANGGLFGTVVGMAIAAGLCGLAQGRAISAACEGTARNPGAAPDIRTTMIIGLALIESLVIFTIVVVFAKG